MARPTEAESRMIVAGRYGMDLDRRVRASTWESTSSGVCVGKRYRRVRGSSRRASLCNSLDCTADTSTPDIYRPVQSQKNNLHHHFLPFCSCDSSAQHTCVIYRQKTPETAESQSTADVLLAADCRERMDPADPRWTDWKRVLSVRSCRSFCQPCWHLYVNANFDRLIGNKQFLWIATSKFQFASENQAKLHVDRLWSWNIFMKRNISPVSECHPVNLKYCLYEVFQ